MTKIFSALLLLSVTFLTNCNGQPNNENNPDEKSWLQLFNGKDLNNWTPKVVGYQLGENFADTWRVEDGLLKVRYDGYKKFDGKFGHLFYKTPYSHYKLRCEYRFVGEQITGGPKWAIRNNGLMLHCQDPNSMAIDQNFPVSVEVQLLGGDGKIPRTTLNLCTPGTHVVMNEKLSKKHCTNSTSKTYHGDQWVTVEVEVQGSKMMRHTINGETVLEYTDIQYDLEDENAQKLVKDGNIYLREGYISIQAETAPIDFRKIELLPLDPKSN